MSNDSLTSSVNAAGQDGPADPVTDGQVTAVREFNRFYTNVIGLLREGLLDTPYSLTEARVLFELAREDAVEVAHLRRWLDIDAGYLSRLLARFEADRLVTRTRSPADGRRQVIGLTAAGRAVSAKLDSRSGGQIRALLAALTPDGRQRLTRAMASIREIIEPAPRPAAFVLRQPAPGELGWVVQRHGALYAAEYGWDASFEALVARIVADFAARDADGRESAWIAELDGEPAGCVFCMRKTGTTAQLRLLLVEPRARGLGMGGRLVAECISFARGGGYHEIVLWTNDVLHAARRIYQRAGFQLAGSQPHHSFGHDLVGEDWRLPLA
jgi:DNA-binding MarR family transcriptional regulator/N-acetylglutamate synthase-like GNAT family acetyltransferase